MRFLIDYVLVQRLHSAVHFCVASVSFAGMPTSAVLAAKRDMVTTLRRLAKKYGVQIESNRDCDADVLLTSYKRVALKAHPDKGGDSHDMTLLTTAREAWETARRVAGAQIRHQ